MRPARHRRFIALALAAASLVLIASTIGAPQSASAAVSLPTPVSTTALPTMQLNGVVWTQIVVGNVVYAGGHFDRAQPAGAAAGVDETPVSNLVAYDVTTGVMIPGFKPVINGQVRGLAISPDHTRLYAVGDFTSVDHRAHSRIAALSATTGAPIESFKASFNSGAYSVVATSSTVYVGGTFTASGSTRRSRAAAVSAISGALQAWAPKVGTGIVRAMVIAPDHSKLVLGGSFSSVNGSTNPGRGMAAVDAVRGRSLPWAANSVIRDGDSSSGIYSLSADATAVYATGESYQSYTGNFEGTVAMSWTGGKIRWIADCHGDTYSSAVFNGAVYTAGHAHYCGNIGGFQQTDPLTYHRAIAFSLQATGTVAPNTLQGPGLYVSYGGQPAPTLLDWYPTFDAGVYTGLIQGPWSVAAGGSYVVYGGEFTTVNGARQTGLTRFLGHPEAQAPVAPTQVGRPSVKALGSTSIAVKWSASTAVAGNAITSYRVNVSRGSTLVKYLSVSAKTRLAVVKGLKKSTKYSIAVYAKNAAGYSMTSAVKTAMTHASGKTVSATKKPSKIAKPSVRASSATAITVTWKTASAPGATPVSSYQVQVSQGTKLIRAIWQSSAKRSVKVSGLMTHTAYRVRLRAANWAGYSAFSTVAGATTGH